MQQGQHALQKKIFCALVARGVSPEQAVLRAGWQKSEQDEAVALLLGNKAVRSSIAKFAREWQEAFPPGMAARAGLERLALGEGAVLQEDGAPTGELFHASEVRYPKGGGMEVQLSDRIKALSLLAQMEDGAEKDGGALLEALVLSAQKLRAGDEPE